jgi:hypothetical protein
VNRHERRKAEALAHYRYGTKHGSPKTPTVVDESKAKKRKCLLMTKQERKNN